MSKIVVCYNSVAFVTKVETVLKLNQIEYETVNSSENTNQQFAIAIVEKGFSEDGVNLYILINTDSSIEIDENQMAHSHAYRILNSSSIENGILIKNILKLMDIQDSLNRPTTINTKKYLQSLIQSNVQSQTQELVNKQFIDLQKNFKSIQYDLSSNLLGLVKIFSMLENDKDMQVRNHHKRVAAASAYIGSKFDLDQFTLFQLHIGSYLHDIGKLAPSQRELTSMCPEEISENFLSMIIGLSDASKIVSCHNSIWSMSEEEKIERDLNEKIAMCASILGIANKYDEMLYDNDNNFHTPEMVITALKRSFFKPSEVNILNELVGYLKSSGLYDSSLYEEIIILDSLKAGMILSKDLKSKSGLLLLSKDFQIDDQIISGLFKRNINDPVEKKIYIYLKSNHINDKSKLPK